MATYPEALRVAAGICGAADAQDVVQESAAVTWKMTDALTSSPRGFFFATVALRARWWVWARRRGPIPVDPSLLAELDAERSQGERGRRVPSRPPGVVLEEH